MPLESASTLSQLDDRYPLPSDPGSRGDDHLRLIKSALKKQFPGQAGNGFSKPITLTEDFLNGLPQMIQDFKDSMDRRWPVGSCVFMANGTDPNGIYPGQWVRMYADASIAFGDGSNNVGAPYGSNDVAVPLPLHSHNASFTGNQLPAHGHSIPGTDVEPYGHGSGILDGGRKDRAAVNYTDSVSAGTPSGSVSIVEAGTPNPIMNVRGARVALNVWKRAA